MRYLGIAKREQSVVDMPDTFQAVETGPFYEAVEIGGGLLLIPPPLQRERLAHIQQLARRSIQEHRKSLEGLAR